MTTWAGWQNEFLLAARIIDTPPNRDFLTEWASHASSPQCRNNPIDLHAKVDGSTNCDRPAGFTAWTQAYPSHADAASAFAQQVNAGQFAAILDTLGTGNPWQDSGFQAVHDALLQWPSVNFAAWYLAKMQPPYSGGGGGGLKAARAHGGWKDLRHTFNVVLPTSVRTSDRNCAAALRSTSKGRRVRR